MKALRENSGVTLVINWHDGEQITIYGGSIQRSIYYVATQNRNYWAAGTAYDDYVENIIATVEKAKGKS